MNDHTLDASVRIDLSGNLEKGAARNERALSNLGRQGSRHLNFLKRTTSSLDSTISRMGNRWVALASGGAIVAAGKQVLGFDADLTRMQTSARMTDEQADKLKNTLQSVANDGDIRIPIDQLTAAVGQFLDKTGDVDYAIDNMRNFGLMMQGLGVEARSTGLLMAQFYEKGVSGPKEVLSVMDRLFAQFSEGSVSVNDIARISAELFSVVQKKGPAAIVEIGALAQVFAKTAGNGDKALTSLKATIRAFNDSKKSATIDAALARNGLAPIREASGLLRSAPKLLLDIIKVANSSVPELSKVFDGESLDGLKSLTDPKNQAQLDRALHSAIEQNLTLVASQKNASTAAASMNSLNNAGRRFADLTLAEPINDLASALNDIDDTKLVSYMETAKRGFIDVGIAILSLKAMKLAYSANQLGHSLTRQHGNKDMGVSKAAPIPVFVVNNVTGGNAAGGMGGDLDGSGNSKKGKPSKRARFGQMALRGGSALLALPAAWELGQSIGGLISNAIEGTAVSDYIGATVARTMANFGNEDAQRAVVNSGDAHPMYNKNYAGYDEYQEQQAQQRVKVELELSPAASKALKAKESPESDNKNIDLELSGSMGAL